MSRLHLRFPFALAFAAGVGLAACGESSPSQANNGAMVDSTAAATGDTVQPPSGVDAGASAATTAPSATPATTPPRRTITGADTEAATTGGKSTVPTALPLLVVTKTPSCGCCHLWVEHMRQAGFQVEIHDVEDMGPVKERVGVPYGKGSCHTAEVGGYFVEGHVPAADVKRLLAEKPDAKGLTLPGMPLGSPGMEMPDGRVQPYVVELVAKDGSTSPFASHGP